MAATKEGFLGKSYVLILFVLVCAGVAAAALAPILKSVADSLFRKDIHLYRVFCRCAAALALLLFLAFHKYLKSQVKASINPKQNPPGKPFLGGFLIGLFALLVVAVIIAVVGNGRFKNPRATTGDFWAAFGIALGVAILIAFIEEIFFRGIVFQGLQADLGAGVAMILAGAFYSLAHFMRPRELPNVSGSDPLGGFKVMIHSFDRFGNFSEILPFAVGLFLLAILLTVAYLKTSSLFLPMGLHASMVFFGKLDDRFFDSGKKASSLLFRSRDTDLSFLKGVDTPLTWIMVVVLTIVIAIVGQKLQSKGGREAPPKRKTSPK